MPRLIFLTLGVIVLLLGLGGATIDYDKAGGAELRDVAWILGGIGLILGGVACAVVERQRVATPPMPPPMPAPPPQPPAWGQPPPHGQQRGY